MKVQDLFEATIKLGARQLPENAKAMLDEFNAGTEPHPFERWMRVWKESVGVTLVFFGGALDLEFITTFSDKNSGEASKALKWVCDLADKHQVEMTLEAVPIKNAGSRTGKNLTKAQLTQWYKRYGFKQDRGEMRRKPK